MADSPARSPHLLRRLNSGVVLRFALGTHEFTAAEAMAHTTLTRSTVLGVCADLVAAGWLEELQDSRAAGLTSKGRPARRYRLSERAGIIVGVDAGEHRYRAVAADLRGRTLVARDIGIDAVRATAEERRAVALRLIDDLVREAGRPGVAPVLVVIGVPAPVDASGRSPRGERGFWHVMNPGFVDHLDGVLVENDANLAAIAERAAGSAADVAHAATVLSGERLGAGVILDGRVLRGARGGAGEMRFLDIVEGVGSAHGIGALAREWAREEVRRGAGGALAGHDDAAIDAEHVFAAAAEGDPVARRIIVRLGARVARVSAVVASLFDVEQIIIAGAIADAAEPVLVEARTRLEAELSPPVPRVVASGLGQNVVVRGAVEFALERIREDPLAFRPHAEELSARS